MASERNAALIERTADLHSRRWANPSRPPLPCALATKISRFQGWSDLWLIHSSGSCQANITMSQWSVWHSITTRGCDRTSPFPLPSLRAVSDIASPLLGNAVYLTCLRTWILYIWVSLSRPLSSWIPTFGHYHVARIKGYRATLPFFLPLNNQSISFLCCVFSLPSQYIGEEHFAILYLIYIML